MKGFAKTEEKNEKRLNLNELNKVMIKKMPLNEAVKSIRSLNLIGVLLNLPVKL